jgi:hypothetical protein
MFGCFNKEKKEKKDAYICVANKHGIPLDTPFVVGTPGHCTLYGGVEADDFEQELIELVQYVMDMVNGVVKDNIDEQHYYVDTFHAMLIHSIVSTVNEALYAKHTDGNVTLYRDDDAQKTKMADGYRLPTKESLQVPTLVLSNHSKCTTMIRWWLENELLLEIELSGNDLHLQMHGSNVPGVKHEIVVKKGVCLQAGDWRCSMTIRHTVTSLNQTIFDPAFVQATGQRQPKPKKDYRYHGVITALKNGSQPKETGELSESSTSYHDDEHENNHLEQDMESSGLPWINLNAATYSDSYKQLPAKKYLECGYERPPKTFGSDMKNWETLTSAPMTKLLLEERFLTYRSIVTLNGQHVEIPTLFELRGQPLLPLQVVKFSDIAAETGVKWGRVHPMSVGDTRFLSVLTLTEAYKSDWANVD